MRYELKKLLGSRWLRIILLLTAAYALLIPWRSSGGLSGLRKQRRANRLAAAVSAAEVNTDSAALLAKANAAESALFADPDRISTADGVYGLGESVYDDWIALRRTADAANYADTTFPMHRVQVVERLLRQNLDLEQNGGKHTYTYRANAYAAEKYNRYVRLESRFCGSVREEQHFLFHYTIWEYVMLMLAVLLSVRMFTLDRQTGAYRVIAASKSGLRGRFLRQFGAVTVVILGMTLFVLGAEIIVMISVYGVRDFSLPVQQWEQYEMCPMQISLVGMLLLQTAARFLVYELAAAIAGALAILFRRALAADALGILLSAGGLLWHMTYILRQGKLTFDQQSRFDVLRTWLPQSLLHPMSYVSGIDCANVFAHPVDRMKLCAACCCVCTGFLLFTARQLCGRKER